VVEVWPFIVGGLALYLLSSAESTNRVFISYDHSEEVHLRNLLEAWVRNPRRDFSFQRTSPLKRINSEDDAVVKRAITRMLKQSDYLLVIVGKATASSEFVNWEIARAQDPDVNLRIAAIKVDRTCQLPKSLRGGRCAWAVGFSEANVLKVLQEASCLH
jgi:hypothetical protein